MCSEYERCVISLVTWVIGANNKRQRKELRRKRKQAGKPLESSSTIWVKHYLLLW